MPYDHPSVVRIASRFCGPEDSGNGGYSCGLFAAAIDSAVTEVSLIAPVPLDADLQLVRPNEPGRPGSGMPEALALAKGKPIAEIRAGESLEQIEPPQTPSVEQATVAGRTSPFLAPDRDFFTSCFVCGPEAERGLGIYAGEIPGSDPPVFADSFQIPDELADLFDPNTGDPDEPTRARPEVVWAALDCPSCLPSFWGETPAVLASLTAEIIAPVPTGTDLVAVGWELDQEGRKLHSATAILDPEGRMLARARALWIRLRASN